MIVEVTSDELTATADYSKVSEMIKRLVEQKRFKLIEILANYLAKKVYSLGNINMVKVVVNKPSASRTLLVENVSAESIAGEK